MRASPLLLGSLLLACTDPAALQQKDAQLAALQSQLAELQKRAKSHEELVQYHLKQAERYQGLVDRRVSTTPKARADLQKLITALSQHGLYPDDGPRIADSLMQRVQRLSTFYNEFAHYQPVDAQNRVTEPLRAIQAMKSFAEAAAKLQPANPNLMVDGLAYQFGDEETSYLLRIDLIALQAQQTPQAPDWLKSAQPKK